MLNNYLARIRAFGLIPYIRRLLFIDFAGLALGLILVLTIAMMSYLWGGLRIWTLNGILICALVIVIGRVIFHHEIGILHSDTTATSVASFLVVVSTFILWAANGFKPIGLSEWEFWLGFVGAIISFVITWPVMILGTSLILFPVYILCRGIRKDKSVS